MHQQPIREWVEQLRKDAGLQAENYRIYMIRDPANATVFYVGQSVDPDYRLWEHFGSGLSAASPIGTFIRENATASGAWLFEQYTLEEAMTLVEITHGVQEAKTSLIDLWVDEAEEALIKLHRPYFNAAHNPNPRELPTCYKSSLRDRPARNPYADQLSKLFNIK